MSVNVVHRLNQFTSHSCSDMGILAEHTAVPFGLICLTNSITSDTQADLIWEPVHRMGFFVPRTMVWTPEGSKMWPGWHSDSCLSEHPECLVMPSAAAQLCGSQPVCVAKAPFVQAHSSFPLPSARNLYHNWSGIKLNFFFASSH